jgi:hypothetical protein
MATTLRTKTSTGTPFSVSANEGETAAAIHMRANIGGFLIWGIEIVLFT